MNQQKNFHFIDQFWDSNILPTLMEYIKIPNKSPQFDKDWRSHGYMDQAVALLTNWCKTHAVRNMTIDVIQMEQRTPVILIDIPGDKDDTVLLYGHLDKQPEMTGWDADLHPWQPVLRGDRLYGRGAADDGYAIFASLTAIKALHEQQIPHARCVILIEASEESGSSDLPFYINALENRLGKPSLIVCLDSGCGNYEQLWTTTSLRGLTGGLLSIHVLKQGIHSGLGSGIVPSCFQILRQLLSRIENETSGEILLKDLFVDIPPQRLQQAEQTAAVLGNAVFNDLPFCEGVKPRTGSIAELLVNRSWKPALSVTGCDGLPPITHAGNVTLPSLTVKLSTRLAPTCDPEKAALAIKTALESNPPYQAQVQYHIIEASSGWNAPLEAPWLVEAVQQASLHYFGQPAMGLGEGGTIPFMGMLGKKFPQAQFLITGVLGPASNAHGPNEFLHIPMAKKLTACIADVIAKHYQAE
ncbi:MAG: M20/M25/M40 family metallo-hydrolase [Gammaproteobacteria bacterium]|nr:MAG: M20/M25/M40 family metallo-hydrolase [Gammaproteobacteria bacterium]